jgi:hypothetical protein
MMTEKDVNYKANKDVVQLREPWLSRAYESALAGERSLREQIHAEDD